MIVDEGRGGKEGEVTIWSVVENGSLFCSTAQIFNRLIRRYKYLLKAFNDNMKKIVMFIKAFSEGERQGLAIFTGLCLSIGLMEANVISDLLGLDLLIRIVFICTCTSLVEWFM